jgi:hypothetical protein
MPHLIRDVGCKQDYGYNKYREQKNRYQKYKPSVPDFDVFAEHAGETVEKDREQTRGEYQKDYIEYEVEKR